MEASPGIDAGAARLEGDSSYSCRDLVRRAILDNFFCRDHQFWLVGAPASDGYAISGAAAVLSQDTSGKSLAFLLRQLACPGNRCWHEVALMCGFAGIVEFGRRTPAADLRESVSRMAASLRHRGPDDEGCWVDAAGGVAFAHRRLAVVDLSPAGHQPMVSASGRYVLNYNGEIYSYGELRRELEAEYPFRGHSDTEVLLAACECWGIEGLTETERNVRLRCLGFAPAMPLLGAR